MPINIPDTLPASETLRNENVFLMTTSRASTQDIRPIRIGILNLMPQKEKTETHLLRMLSNTPLQVEIVLLFTKTHISTHTSWEHLNTFYKSIDEVNKLDGLIITGAPIEHLEFKDVEYWDELVSIYEWAKTNVTSTLHICWGAQAALYYLYGIQKYNLDHKVSGIFKHKVLDHKEPIVRGFDDEFLAPHSRNTCNRREDILACPELKLVSESEEAGPYLIVSQDGKNIFVTGHSEYDPLTLRDEYLRDEAKGLNPEMPQNYFPNNDPSQMPKHMWKSHGNLLFGNWLNYYVYQQTPYSFD